MNSCQFSTTDVSPRWRDRLSACKLVWRLHRCLAPPTRFTVLSPDKFSWYGRPGPFSSCFRATQDAKAAVNCWCTGIVARLFFSLQRRNCSSIWQLFLCSLLKPVVGTHCKSTRLVYSKIQKLCSVYEQESCEEQLLCTIC
jgi:hypothetical protein